MSGKFLPIRQTIFDDGSLRIEMFQRDDSPGNNIAVQLEVYRDGRMIDINWGSPVSAREAIEEMRENTQGREKYIPDCIWIEVGEPRVLVSVGGKPMIYG